eukprot:CAMPEP_0182429260 /NCGR_PEP_ID=MMETSP1167-20130531/25631_1 /TAXON_ID=2988 /ORGANISM="Mallomonas Sp, Strain CCMP3275" /LENGTH=419 /DNA_ID=CAMNT_0024612669 /DNA_START=325 /DNA_END=1584 /DNA_ORIENTATION=-
MVEAAANRLAEGQVVAWFQGRSEFGQRALGNRCILADPRQANLRRFINEEVKEREWFRPLAPSVLSSAAGDWFQDLTNDQNVSPYMSLTAFVRPERRDEVPAVCHVDGSARLQTVSEETNPLYHQLIREFCKRTRVPMLLNTSFNRRGQPIVETPEDAIATLLACNGKITSLYMSNYEVHIRGFPFESSGLAGLASEPSASENDLVVKARSFYMSEIVASPFTPDAPTRIRIQTGKETGGDEDGWTSLDSTLQLELLQLLQVPPDSDYEGGEEISDVLEAIRAVRNENLSWQEVKEALRGLFFLGLVSFHDPEAEVDGPGPGPRDGDGDVIDVESVTTGTGPVPSPVPVYQQQGSQSVIETETETKREIEQKSREEKREDESFDVDEEEEDEDDEAIYDNDDIDYEGLFKGVDVVDLRT